jgi:hypothetical protein
MSITALLLNWEMSMRTKVFIGAAFLMTAIPATATAGNFPDFHDSVPSSWRGNIFRADGTTGWIFATYSYDGSRGGAGWWDRMVPVGAMWGNDPSLDKAASGAGARVKESWINPDSRTPQHLGFLGRLNGPVDNPASACLSCHMTAEVPARSGIMPPANSADPMRWFANMPAGDSFDQRSDRDRLQSANIQRHPGFPGWKQTAQGGYVAPPTQPAAASPPMAGPAPMAMSAAGPPVSTTDDQETMTIDGERVYKVAR